MHQATPAATDGPPVPPPPTLLPVGYTAPAQQQQQHQQSYPLLWADPTAAVRLCGICSSPNHLKRNCPRVTCLACSQTGHFRQDCPVAVAEPASPGDGRPAPAANSACWACGSPRHVQANCPVRLQSLECHQCHQIGHTMTACPQTRCFNCGTYGHSSQACRSQPHCFHCARAGHRSSECPIRFKGRVCYQCQEPGHEAANCPQGQLCRRCRQPGHLIARCPAVQCDRCREMGHTAEVCDRGPAAATAGSTATTSTTATATAASVATGPETAANVGVCSQCGSGAHSSSCCGSPGWQYSYSSYQEGFEEEEDEPAQVGGGGGPLPIGAAPSPPRTKAEDGESDGSPLANPGSGGGTTTTTTTVPISGVSQAASAVVSPVAATAGVPPYVPTGAPRAGRVAVVIDGPYFERCVQSAAAAGSGGGNPQHTAAYYTRVTEALRQTLAYLGDIFGREPIAFWFDTDPGAFTEFLETAMPLEHRESAFRETALRTKYLTDEMNGDRSLHTVVARLVGGMKRQYGYTRDGPGYVWVQTGVDVAISTAVIEHFSDTRQYQQVILLCGDSDVYPAVHYCNTLRRQRADGAGGPANPVRVCGTSSSISKLYGQHQDLSDFLPRILLDRPSHSEKGRTFEFPTSAVFL